MQNSLFSITCGPSPGILGSSLLDHAERNSWSHPLPYFLDLSITLPYTSKYFCAILCQSYDCAAATAILEKRLYSSLSDASNIICFAIDKGSLLFAIRPQ